MTNTIKHFSELLEPPEGISPELYIDKLLAKVYNGHSELKKVITHRILFLSYCQAKKLMVQLCIKNNNDYKKIYKENNLPSNPVRYYSREWTTWRKFLSNSNTLSKKYLAFTEARTKARALYCKTYKEYKDICRKGGRPSGIHYEPNKYYKDWVSWPDFVGYLKK